MRPGGTAGAVEVATGLFPAFSKYEGWRDEDVAFDAHTDGLAGVLFCTIGLFPVLYEQERGWGKNQHTGRVIGLRAWFVP